MAGWAPACMRSCLTHAPHTCAIPPVTWNSLRQFNGAMNEACHAPHAEPGNCGAHDLQKLPGNVIGVISEKNLMAVLFPRVLEFLWIFWGVLLLSQGFCPGV